MPSHAPSQTHSSELDSVSKSHMSSQVPATGQSCALTPTPRVEATKSKSAVDLPNLIILILMANGSKCAVRCKFESAIQQHRANSVRESDFTGVRCGRGWWQYGACHAAITRHGRGSGQHLPPRKHVVLRQHRRREGHESSAHGTMHAFAAGCMLAHCSVMK